MVMRGRFEYLERMMILDEEKKEVFMITDGKIHNFPELLLLRRSQILGPTDFEKEKKYL